MPEKSSKDILENKNIDKSLSHIEENEVKEHIELHQDL